MKRSARKLRPRRLYVVEMTGCPACYVWAQHAVEAIDQAYSQSGFRAKVDHLTCCAVTAEHAKRLGYASNLMDTAAQKGGAA